MPDCQSALQFGKPSLFDDPLSRQRREKVVDFVSADDPESVQVYIPLEVQAHRCRVRFGKLGYETDPSRVVDVIEGVQVSTLDDALAVEDRDGSDDLTRRCLCISVCHGEQSRELRNGIAEREGRSKHLAAPTRFAKALRMESMVDSMESGPQHAGPEAAFVPPGVVHVGDELAAAPLWRREPYRVFFPLGVVLAWAGVSHWLAHAAGLLADYRPVFHAVTQIQGFMSCFAVGFLFTMLPRRTGSGPPAPWQMFACMGAVAVTTLASWGGRWALSQVAWLVLAFTVIGFAVSRFLSGSSRRKPPNAFVWIPAAFLMGIAGSVMTGAYGALGPDYFWVHNVGRGLILQGMFTGLVMGVGSLAIPLMTRSKPPADGAASRRDYLERGANLAAAILLAASFVIEAQLSLQLGLAIRAVVSLTVLVLAAGILNAPTQPGRNRWIVWGAAWMLPLGYAMAAAFPHHYKAGLHVVFLGGFALLAFAVSTQVILGHGGYKHEMAGRPWQVAAMAGLVLAAMVPRALMEFDPSRFFLWLGASASLFLAATIIWVVFLVPKILATVRAD